MSGVHRKERGESRAIYTAIADDLDFLLLHRHAKLLWYTLKMKLGASGIGVMYMGELAEVTTIPAPELDAALTELEVTQWLRRERNVLWLRNALRFDPYLSLANRLHVQGIVSHLAGLPRLQIVSDFCGYYGLEAAWLGNGVPDPYVPAPIETLYQTLSSTYAKQEVGSRSKEEEPSRASPASRVVPQGSEPKKDDPAEWMHALWQEVLGSDRPLVLTASRRQKYRAMYAEQLEGTPDPVTAWRAVLWAVTQSEHHMKERDYQMPESLLRSPERREKWVERTIHQANNNQADKRARTVLDLADYLKKNTA